MAPDDAGYAPYEPREPLRKWYQSSADEWQADGCGELEPDGDTSDGCETPRVVAELRQKAAEQAAVGTGLALRDPAPKIASTWESATEEHADL
jgi:hypothetical protein